MKAHWTFFRLKLKRIKWRRSESPSLLKPSDHVLCLLCAAIVQGTRGLMLASILLSVIAILVEMVGMRCTTCMAEEQQQKDRVALAGGIVLVIAGQRPFTSERLLKAAIKCSKAVRFPSRCVSVWPQFDRQPEALFGLQKISHTDNRFLHDLTSVRQLFNVSLCWWVSRSARPGGNVLVRPQDSEGFLQPVYSH